MPERLYYYRGFDIGVQAQPVSSTTQSCSPTDPVRYHSVVRIRKLGSSLCLHSFTLYGTGHQPFEDEFEAVVNSCFAAERRINLHHATSVRQPHLGDANGWHGGETIDSREPVDRQLSEA